MLILTNCEICECEIDDTAINQCPVCGLDGLCDECLHDHECEMDE